jgi:putative endonuclease
MGKHKETGIKGEVIAVSFLLKKGYNILHTNWRAGRKEVDIIAEKGGVAIFVEVKTRRNFDFGFPEEAVDIKKQAHLKQIAEAFCDMNTGYTDIRFDVISILLHGDKVEDILHLEDAFY